MKTAVAIAVVLLLVGSGLAQTRQSDSDVPVLKRRPAPADTEEQAPPEQTQPRSTPNSTSTPQSSSDPMLPPPDNAASLPDTTLPPDTATSATAPPRASAPPVGNVPRPQPHAAETSNVPDENAEVRERGSGATRSARPSTIYEFIETRSGGLIRVTVDDPNDTDRAANLSVRLRSVAAQFARGDFSSRVSAAPGVKVMRELRNKITYTAHAIQDGGELIISSEDPKAVAAIHQFLQYQRQQQ